MRFKHLHVDSFRPWPNESRPSLFLKLLLLRHLSVGSHEFRLLLGEEFKAFWVHTMLLLETNIKLANWF